VYGVLKTSASVSPGVGATSMFVSLLSLTVLYGVLLVIEARLLARYAKAGPPTEEEVLGGDDHAEPSLTLAY
jgi:cytochrome d ubiquinol oxidase subunit I